MKLVASLLCVGALTLVGCVDQETTGGGQLEGLRPAKPSIDNPNDQPTGTNPTVFEGMNATLPPTQMPVETDGIYGHLGGTMLPPEPAPEVCENCQVIAIRYPTDNGGIDEVRVVSDGGLELCRIYLTEQQVVLNECWSQEP